MKTSIRKLQTGPTVVHISASAPTVSNDNTQGYGVESLWFRSTTQVMYVCENAATGAAVWTALTSGGGGGTVTAVSVATANGFSGSSSGGATPALTIVAGAITPSSVAATGSVTGSNLSGTNTGDQTSVSGNAGTATALQNSRTIAGKSFDGTANITIASTDLSDTANIVLNSNTITMTNKRITKRYITTTQSATPTINTDSTDVSSITGLAQAITSFTTNLSGTPQPGDALILEITDDGTPRAIAWGASFESSTVSLPTTTATSTLLTIGLRWNPATSKWRCVAVA